MHDNTQKPPIIFLEKKKKSFLLYTQNVDGPENVAL
jgi:NAD-dependent SIR2 family protein deacetylase